MKSYRQYCGLALALDRVGDRWTLLVVRELLSGPKRFKDLMAGAPGIATNLLADRLRSLEHHGLVEQRNLPPPADVAVYALTGAGEELREPVRALVRWGGRFMRERKRSQSFRPHWLANALEAQLAPRLPELEEPIRLAVTLREGDVGLELSPDGVGLIDKRDGALQVRGSVQALLGLASGALSAKEASAAGLELTGPPAHRRAFRALVGPG